MHATPTKSNAKPDATEKAAVENRPPPRKPLQPKLTQQQLETHLWGAANILRGKTAGQDYKNYILSLMFYKRLCDQWAREADEAIAEVEKQQGMELNDRQKAVFRKRGEHRFNIPEGSQWGDVLAASTNLGDVLTKAMRAVANANDELRGVFTVDWNQPAPDGSGKPLIPNEVVHALIQHFDEYDLSNQSVPGDILGRAYEYLIKQFSVYDLVYKTNRVLQERANARGIQLAMTGVRAIIRGSQKSFPIVPAVLVENAIKYGTRNSTITADISANGKLAVLAVRNESDHPIDSKNCFERGSRYAPGAAEGAGFGLFLAKQIVLAHHGSIRCQTIGRTISMIVELPLEKVIP